jgi:ATP-dependent Clp protease ATP-binding subunit ClpC
VAELGYQLNLSDKAKHIIAEKGFDKQFGARPLKSFQSMLKIHRRKS